MRFEDMKAGLKVQTVKIIEWYPIGRFSPGLTGKVVEVLLNMKMARVQLDKEMHLLSETGNCIHVTEWPGSECRAECFEIVEVAEYEKSWNDAVIDTINEIIDAMPEQETRQFRERIRETATKFRESVKAMVREYHTKRAAEESETISIGDFDLVELCEKVERRFNVAWCEITNSDKFLRTDRDKAKLAYQQAKALRESARWITELTGKT